MQNLGIFHLLTAAQKEEFKVQTRGMAFACDYLILAGFPEASASLMKLIVDRQEFLRLEQ